MKKKGLTITILVLALALVFAACGSSAPAEAETEEAMAPKTFTLEELATYDGQDGNPAYIAIDGVVYDISNVPQWASGSHFGGKPGMDLSDQMKAAPHGLAKLAGLKEVGTLAE